MSEGAADLPAPIDASGLEARAPGLARAHQPLNRARASGAELVDLRGLSRSIARATREFRTPRPEDPVYQKAAEWLLDNQFLVARTVRQVGSELPKGFRRRLPHVGADELPRVLRISHALVEATSLDFDEAALLGFIVSYQKQAPLGIAELWALPTMLRISVLEALVQMLDVFFPPTRARPRWWDLLVDPAVGISRAIRALRLLSEIDWKAFFQNTSAVDAALQSDPAGVYAAMDFETRDAYRKVVEELAWVAELPESDVAGLAVCLAREGAGDPREAHVGYYLVGPGRKTLEKRIRYRPKGRERLRRWLLDHPTLAYLGLTSTATLAMLAGVSALFARALGTNASMALFALAIVPLSSIAVAFTNWRMTAFLSPRTLPKLDFSEKIPDGCKTAVVIPALVANAGDVDDLLAQLELHYLANPDPALAFVLLTDHVDNRALECAERSPAGPPYGCSSTYVIAVPIDISTKRIAASCHPSSMATTNPRLAPAKKHVVGVQSFMVPSPHWREASHVPSAGLSLQRRSAHRCPRVSGRTIHRPGKFAQCSRLSPRRMHRRIRREPGQ